jgi:hypothetical protein
MNVFEMKVHPAAEVFPMLSEDELSEAYCNRSSSKGICWSTGATGVKRAAALASSRAWKN